MRPNSHKLLRRLLLSIGFLGCCLGAPGPATGQSSASATSEAVTDLVRPIRASLRVEGRSTPLRGQVTAWSFGAFWIVRDGGQTPVRVDWRDLNADQVYSMMRQALARDDARGYLELGATLLSIDETDIASRALQVAARLQPELDGIIGRLLEAHASGADPLALLAEDVALATPPSEPERSGAAPDPGLDQDPSTDPNERATARTAEMSTPFARVESEHFLTLMQPCGLEAQSFSSMLEQTYTGFAGVLGLGEGERFFDAKCVCYVLGDSDDYRGLAKQFNRTPNADRGQERMTFLFVDDGAVVEMGFYDQEQLASVWQYQMYLDVARAIIDRHDNARRLPLWLEQGLTRYVWILQSPGSASERQQFRRAREYCKFNSVAVFIRRNVEKFDALSNQSLAVSHLLVQALIAQKPEEFKTWIRMIKAGDDWERSLEECMGFDVDTLGAWFEQQLGITK
ncbi:MAG: hypothetical protein H6814_09330 [Phycisphaeraceae bacterium]|nr:hypothetical protein [Phycisphaeraceae bacterium]